MSTLGTVYLIDDESEQRRSLAALLNVRGYPTVEFVNTEEFEREQVGDRKPGVIVLDFIFQGSTDGLTFLGRHRDRLDGLPVIVLTGHADVSVAVQFMKAGASTLLLKPLDPEELFENVEKAIEWDVRTLPVRKKAELVRRTMQLLSERQRTVQKLILEGLANKAIAAQLQLSERTIELERAEILRMFQVKNAVELAVLVTESSRSIDPLSIKSSPSVRGQAALPRPHFDSGLRSREALPRDESRIND